MERFFSVRSLLLGVGSPGLTAGDRAEVLGAALRGCRVIQWREEALGYLVVPGDALSAGRRFGSDQLLLLLHPAVHVRVGQLGPPAPEGLGGPLGRPRAPRGVRTEGAPVRWMHGDGGGPRRPVRVLGLARAQQGGGAEAAFEGRLGRRLSAAQGQEDRLLLELLQRDAAGAALALVPVPGLEGGATVDVKVVEKKRRQVARVLRI
ncbi:hypothetical protein EYF80_051321 [Liparis tanakae]|uniref:Uncharacterized protein n=1 Tax=Liparis tanakae TaxID=230148 RepID=A0A4Z2FC81_9TELE|nr:hypothetical protein EYF80_051321 [Liparis tanakae]